MAEIVVVDMDPGIDDVYGLILLVNADNLGLISLAAIICSFGNTIVWNTCKNVIRMLEVMGRTDIPVYQGVNNTLIVPQYFDDYFGVDGFGDVEGIWEPDMSILRQEGAVDALYDIASESPGRVSLIALGPLTFTTISLILRDNIPLKDVWIMGGNSTEFEEPEFNFRNDPEAAYSVLNRIGVPIYILTFDACSATTTQVGWRKNTLGTITNNLMSVLNQVEAFRIDEQDDSEAWPQCDAITVGALIDENIHKTLSEYCGSISLSNCDSSTNGGFLLLDSNCGSTNVILVENIDSDAFEKSLYEAVSNF